MNDMFREYSTWRTKLEQIEGKMRGDVEFWKQAAEKANKDNERAQRETAKAREQVAEKVKEIETKNILIDKLQKQAQANKILDTVEEQLCSNCRSSLEESQIFTARLSSLGGNPHHHQSSTDDSTLRELSERVSSLESQVLMYRERVAYHESVEEELKRNLESQVDVVLKMEEERLMLLKEGKEVKERENRVRDENRRMRDRIE